MHKYFAKTLFLGKKVEFLPECHSTNKKLLQMSEHNDIPEGMVIYADHQTEGKGQRGNVWVSEKGKNLLFSLLLKPKGLKINEIYLLNIVAGLAVIQAVDNLAALKCELKWPNDIYVSDKKMGGILVETSLDQKSIGEAVVGIGLNVGQSHFSLPTATSLILESGTKTDRMILLEEIIYCFEKYYLMLLGGGKSKILQAYNAVLRWRGELHAFSTKTGQIQGEIIGIDDTGRLLINSENKMMRFDVKEVVFLH